MNKRHKVPYCQICASSSIGLEGADSQHLFWFCRRTMMSLYTQSLEFGGLGFSEMVLGNLGGFVMPVGWIIWFWSCSMAIGDTSLAHSDKCQKKTSVLSNPGSRQHVNPYHITNICIHTYFFSHIISYLNIHMRIIGCSLVLCSQHAKQIIHAFSARAHRRCCG